MSVSPRCPKCQAELPADAPQGLCPKCLLQAAWDSQSANLPSGAGESVEKSDPATDPTRLVSSGFIPPSVEELAPLFPQLEFIELLGRGGMGAVYKARQKGLDRFVAVKILPTEISHDPSFAERFQREARALAKLSHPHIVAVYDFGVARPESSKGVVRASDSEATPFDDSGRATQGGLCYFVMEFVDGANLRQTIKAGKLAPKEALAIVPQICEALQFAHDEGVVHRDIKPENILIDKRGRVKIADFGLAKLLGQDANDHSLTATHQVMGTLRYMAPEQMQGSREVDHRADIYSLGVVFYELLTGELPMGKFAPPSKRVQVDVRFDEVVLRALEQDPEQRYQHASDVKSEIDSIRTTPAPSKAVEQRDPLEPFREVARFAMTPNPSYARRVGIPMAILFGLFSMVTITAHSVYGQKDNYQEKPLVLILSNGAILLWLAVIILHITFFARRRVSMKATPTPFDDSGRAIQPPSQLVQNPADCLLLAAGIAFVTAIGVAAWLLAVPTNSSNQVTNSLVRGNLFGISSTLAVYSVLIGIAGLMMRRLQTRLFVLLVNVIIGLFLPAVIALNVVMELRNIPVWPAAIPFWIGMPAALWVVVTLFRDDVRGAFNAAAEQRRLRDFSNPSQQPPKSVDEPRFSRFAIAGAVWALFGVLAIIPTLYFIGLNRVWNGTALPTDIIYEAPPLAFTIFMGALLAIGAGAPIGTTIYGAIAIGHIKRSGGKIIGLPLAVVDVFFFPLLVVFAGVAFPVSLALHAILPLQMIAVAIPSAMLALVVCLIIGFTVWCKVIPDSALAAITLRERLRIAGIVLLIAGIMDAVCGLVWIGHTVSVLVELLQHGAPFGWQLSQTCLSLGSLWIVYYVVGVALHLMTLEDDGDFTFCLLTAAIVPPGCLIGLPVAIYAMVQLSKPEVKALIPAKPPELAATPPADKHETVPSQWEFGVQTWWLARSNGTCKMLWVVLNCFCAFCIFAFLSFEGVSDTDQNTHFQIGLLDPWFVFESNHGPGKRSVSGIFLAWSWLFGIGAYGSGWLLFKFKRWSESRRVPRNELTESASQEISR